MPCLCLRLQSYRPPRFPLRFTLQNRLQLPTHRHPCSPLFFYPLCPSPWSDPYCLHPLPGLPATITPLTRSVYASVAPAQSPWAAGITWPTPEPPALSPRPLTQPGWHGEDAQRIARPGSAPHSCPPTSPPPSFLGCSLPALSVWPADGAPQVGPSQTSVAFACPAPSTSVFLGMPPQIYGHDSIPWHTTQT